MKEAGMNGLRVHGGYKGLRRLLLEEINRPRNWVVLEGLTGSGKTELLRRLDSRRVVDLEELACHRGSAFGGFLSKPQPAQQTFENSIGLRLFGSGGAFVVENESSTIGRCALPGAIRCGIAQGKIVRLTAGMDERVTRIFEEYVAEPVRENGVEKVLASLRRSIERITKALGGARSLALLRMLDEAFKSEVVLARHRPWIEFLLVEYYDPRYQYGLKRDERPLLFEGDAKAVSDYLGSV
jgi:tRNA 2-selenouridine synthase